MRNQSNELLELAKELRAHVASLNIPMDVNNEGNNVGKNIRVSNNVRMHYNTDYNYASIECGTWPNAVTITLFENGDFINNTITINVEKTDDVELDELILRFTEDIVTFKASNTVEHVSTN